MLVFDSLFLLERGSYAHYLRAMSMVLCWDMVSKDGKI